MERSYADRANGATNFDPEAQFDKDIESLPTLVVALKQIANHKATVEALKAELSCTCCDIPCPLEALARIDALEAQLAAAREALEKIGGDREYSAADIASHAQKPHKTIDESVAEAALASLPAPEAALSHVTLGLDIDDGQIGKERC